MGALGICTGARHSGAGEGKWRRRKGWVTVEARILKTNKDQRRMSRTSHTNNGRRTIVTGVTTRPIPPTYAYKAPPARIGSPLRRTEFTDHLEPVDRRGSGSRRTTASADGRAAWGICFGRVDAWQQRWRRRKGWVTVEVRVFRTIESKAKDECSGERRQVRKQRIAAVKIESERTNVRHPTSTHTSGSE